MRERATHLGLAALALVALVLLWRFPVLGEAYLGVDRLSGKAPFRTGDARAKNPLDQDPVLCTFPREARIGESLRAGNGAPRWEPGLGAGEPVSLVNAAAPDYPVYWLAYRILPAWAAHATLILLHLALALAGTFLLLRVRGSSAEAAVAGALVYGLSGELPVWLELDLWTIAAAFVPWALLGIELAAARSLRWIGLAGIALGAAILGGHLQIAALGLALSVVHALVLARGRLARRLLVAVASVVLGLGIGSARLAPAFTELGEGARERIPFDRWFEETASLTPSRLVLLVAPDLLGDPVAGTEMTKGRSEEGVLEVQANPQEIRFSPGVVALALALAAARRKKNMALAVLALGALVLAMPTPLAWPLWRFAPGFGSTAPTRVLAVFPLLVGLLAAEGWDGWRRGESSPWLALGVTLALLVFGAASVKLGPRPELAGGRALAKPLALSLAALTVVLTSRGKPDRMARAMLLALVVFDLAEATSRWNPSGSPALLYPETETVVKTRELVGPGSRVLADRGVPPDVLLQLGLRGIGSYGSAHPRRFARLVDALSPPRYRRASKQWLLAWRLPQAWRDALSIRAVLLDSRDDEGSDPSVRDGLTLVSSGDALLFMNPTALSRARLVPIDRVRPAENETEALERVRDPGFDPRTEVVLELGDFYQSLKRSPPLDAGPVLEAEIVVDSPERVVVKTRHRDDAFLFLADTLASGWTATVGGHEAAIYPADVAFRSVFVPRGEHELVFMFRPPGWPVAWVVSLFGLACCLVLLSRVPRA